MTGPILVAKSVKQKVQITYGIAIVHAIFFHQDSGLSLQSYGKENWEWTPVMSTPKNSTLSPMTDEMFYATRLNTGACEMLKVL